MAEYLVVEKPFLDQLENLGWEITDQGQGIPHDPAMSYRSNFREVALFEEFKQSVSSINRTEDGQQWLTDKQLGDLYNEIFHQPTAGLIEANEKVLKLLFKAQVDVNEITGESDPVVKLIDFDNPERNTFRAINQFRIDTPGGVKDYIIPDIVLFVNGLPLVVIECKDANEYTSNPIHEAVEQLRRYSDQREQTIAEGLREGEPALFFANQLLIATCGDEAEFGSITATEDYFFAWKDIYPVKHKEYEPPLGRERAQEILIQGMLPPETLLDIIRTCTVFMDVGDNRVKAVCRYQQYRAADKIVEKLRNGGSFRDRSGVVWHTQGSGKSLTMVFTVRKIRMCDDLKDLKILFMTDRKDLEKQLGQTAELTGENVTYIQSTQALRKNLHTDASNLNMVMVHKFGEHQHNMAPEYLAKAIDAPRRYDNFGVVNPSERIVIMIDEAHRSHNEDLGNNVFEAFPAAARIAFTGTPLLSGISKAPTIDKFGGYIDKYRLQDAVEDGATVQILYEGKTADTAIYDKHEFDRKFEDLFKKRTDEEILEIKKRYGATGDILEAEGRIEEIATDLVDHYIENILCNGFKAQVVASSKMAAARYVKYIRKAIESRIELEKEKPTSDESLITKLAFLQTAAVLSADGTNDPAVITKAIKEAKKFNAIANFKKAFDPERPETGMAILVVCDRLLTGFDAPIEQVMYIDKKIKEHNLLQTIARVNRIADGKTRGYIVDYIGLANHLHHALSIYGKDEDYADIQMSMLDIDSEIPTLESRYRRLLYLFSSNGLDDIEDFVQQKIDNPELEYNIVEEAIGILENIKRRADFEVYFKKFLQSMDIILPNAAATPYKIPVKRFGYILARTKQRYKDNSLNISGAGEKVKQLVNEHLISLGIDPKIPAVELFSANFDESIEENKSTKAKASEMEHAIRKHCKIQFGKDPEGYARMSEKLEALIRKHKEDWDKLYKSLLALCDEVRKIEDKPVDDPFLRLTLMTTFGTTEVDDETKGKTEVLIDEVLKHLQKTIGIIDFWDTPVRVRELKGEISIALASSGIPEVIEKMDQVETEIVALAKHRHKELLALVDDRKK
ncbi:type I restriction endonuclease subunit R [Maridesulfovibrio salexigens]|uniref:Type I restriction enzyme endonuclease subunit n=1 Tax=Maridesulfovibrio salexigens (strain ATCC 14822 / DSM 2638 / NCIMB 8403 / VKM B-1763) TaxID=526222 RepID=C6BT20_MARSD|nr:HsdR family type I site-specific deoxyribonuclease [Maridesulfovibrio salexigens]ACS79724.1 type I site-specific deoxyribonuclease, HsdR family [Maridesulfovibrio salexigens DSM 2638]